MEIGFEYIKMYGFQSGHFEEVLAAYRKTGKFPNPDDFKLKQEHKPIPLKTEAAGSELNEFIVGLNNDDPFQKPQIKNRKPSE